MASLASEINRRRAVATRTGGFTLIEVVVTLAVVATVAVVMGLFLVTGVNSYTFSKEASDKALKAQTALDRMALELRNIADDGTLAIVDNASATYKSEGFDGTRVLKAAGGNIYVNVDDTADGLDNGTDYLLLDDVSNFTLSYTPGDLDDEAGNEVAYIELGFDLTVDGNPINFELKVYPRNMLPEPT